MIEITTFGLMVLALIAGTLGRDYWRASRNQQRRIQMDAIVTEFTRQPLLSLVALLGDPYEIDQALSGRALYTWKAPPNQKLPQGTGLLTLVVTVEADGVISDMEWRDRT